METFIQEHLGKESRASLTSGEHACVCIKTINKGESCLLTLVLQVEMPTFLGLHLIS